MEETPNVQPNSQPSDPIIDTDADAPFTEAEREYLLRRIRELGYGTQERARARAGIEQAQMSKLLNRRGPAKPVYRKALLAVLGPDAPPAPTNGLANSLDKPDAALSAEAAAALASRGEGTGDAGVRGAVAGLRGVRSYPGYILWGRDDPRDEATLAAARSRGRHVIGDEGELDGYPDVRCIRVEQVGPLAIETDMGPVGANWRLFVHMTDDPQAVPVGATVAAMSERGQLVVGELRQDDDGRWSVGSGEWAEAIRREDVIGPILKIHPPPLWLWDVKGPTA